MFAARASALVAVDALSWDTTFGLPTHPLIVHAVVVLLPLAALGAIWITVSRRASRRFAAVIVPLAWIGAVASLIAEDTGWLLAEQVGLPQEHATMADSLPVFALLLAASITGFWLVDRGIPGNRRRPPWFVGAGICLDLLAIAVIVWAIRVGHSGAIVTWSGR
jgi:hypothetical protein